MLNYNEQVVGRLGSTLLTGIVPEVALALVPQETVEKFSLADVTPGLCHASRFLEGLGDREPIRKPSKAAAGARIRIAQLGALLRLCATEGRHFFYREPPDCKDAFVYSVDHGSSFLDASAGIPDGQEGQWLNRPPTDDAPASICFEMFTTAGLTREEVAGGASVLEKFTNQAIEEAVYAPPESDFGVLIDQRDELAKRLQRRRDELLADAYRLQKTSGSS